MGNFGGGELEVEERQKGVGRKKRRKKRRERKIGGKKDVNREYKEG